MPEQIQVERTIRGAPDVLYALVSDLPRMGDWSPENTGGTWLDGAGPVVGARFKGSNRSGWFRWHTDVVITVVKPGEEFGFDVTLGPFKVANWTYRFEQPDGAAGATRVIETWTDHRVPVFGTIASLFIGVRDRPGLNRRNMEATLAKLAEAVET